MTDTNTLLNETIHEQNISRNSLIANLGIDRSSFYQILSGKRIGTIEQFTGILSNLDLTPELLWSLTKEFAERKFGEDYNLYEMVDEQIKKLSESDLSKNTATNDENSSSIVSDIRNMIVSNIKQQGPDLCLYIPLSLFNMIWLQTDVLRKLASADSPSLRILVHIDMNEKEKIEDKLSLLFSFLFGLYHIRNFSEIVRFVYVNDQINSSPFPFFAVQKESIYLINSSCEKSVTVSDRELISEYTEFFLKLAARQYEYLENYNSFEKFIASLYHRFTENAGTDKHNRMVERRPCIFKIVNKKEISRYADESLKSILLPYLSMFNKMNSSFLNSYSALEEFRSDHTVMENGLKFNIDSCDAELICKRAEKASVDDILLLRNAQDHLPKNYTFALFSTEELMILPNYGYDHIISIKDPALFHAFSAWFDVNKEMALITLMVPQK